MAAERFVLLCCLFIGLCVFCPLYPLLLKDAHGHLDTISVPLVACFRKWDSHSSSEGPQEILFGVRGQDLKTCTPTQVIIQKSKRWKFAKWFKK